jgi:hypothetical protein
MFLNQPTLRLRFSGQNFKMRVQLSACFGLRHMQMPMYLTLNGDKNSQKTLVDGYFKFCIPLITTITMAGMIMRLASTKVIPSQLKKVTFAHIKVI